MVQILLSSAQYGCSGSQEWMNAAILPVLCTVYINARHLGRARRRWAQKYRHAWQTKVQNIYIYILHYSCYASEVTAKKEKFTLVQSVMWLRSACTTISIGLLCKIVVSFFSSCFVRTISSTSRSHIFVWVVQNMYFNQKHHTNLYASLVCCCSLPLGLLCPSGKVAPLTSFTIRWNA